MRAVSVHPDAIVVTSLLWQTNATAIRAGDEAMLVDSPYFPDELELLPTVLAQSGFEPNALLATHGDWDHLLARLAFPDLSMGLAEGTMLRIRERPGEAQRAAPRRRRRALRAPAAPAGAGPDAVPAGARPPRAGRARAGASPGRGPHARRDGRVRSLARPAGVRRLPLRRGDPDAQRGRLGGRVPRHARAAGAAGGASRDGGAGTRLAVVARARAGAARRGSRLSRRARAAATRSRGCPTGRDDARQRAIHHENVTELG